MPLDPEKQLGGASPNSVNEEFFDALVRHQIGLMRLSGGIRNKVVELLNATEQDLADKIRSRLANATGLDTPRAVQRMESLLKVLRATRVTAWNQIDELWVKEMLDLAQGEPRFIDGALKTVAPVVVDTVIPTTSTLRSIATTRPFQGRTLREWARSVRRADLQRIESQIKIGMVNGESGPQIARRIVGSARLRGRDGATEITRRQADAVTRTAVNAIANQARREFYLENDELFQEELYTATLDSRTTPICMSLDGTRYRVGDGPYPPQHIRCRSLRVAILDGDALGRRPARRFTEQQLLREYAGREGIRPPSTRAALPRGHKGTFDQFRGARIRELTGTVPAKVSYQEWLSRQPAAFQDDVLGRTKARLFRKGNLTLNKFVNRQGDELTLSQLARREADAFRAAGLDPEDFR